jgi:hypothetical protein
MLAEDKISKAHHQSQKDASVERKTGAISSTMASIIGGSASNYQNNYSTTAQMRCVPHNSGNYRGGMSTKLMIAVMLLMVVGAQPVFAGGDMFGAIAYNIDNGAYGWAVDRVTQMEADAAALEHCGQGCEVVVQFKNTCAAIALGDDNAWGWARADQKAVAQRNAVANCAKHGTGCVVKAWACTNR